jgi:hypothetical protein
VECSSVVRTGLFEGAQKIMPVSSSCRVLALKDMLKGLFLVETDGAQRRTAME